MVGERKGMQEQGTSALMLEIREGRHSLGERNPKVLDFNEQCLSLCKLEGTKAQVWGKTDKILS